MSDALNRIVSSISLATNEHLFVLECGEQLHDARIAYETYGYLNATRDNAVLVCHALTGSAHAAGVDIGGAKGWWDDLIGPGRAIDTDRMFVVCANVIGGCYGSTGPTSIDPRTGVAYGESFPFVTIRDSVRAQRELIDHLGIERLQLVIGGSMGGFQVLEWAVMYPEIVERIAPIATSAQHSAWCIGFNAIAREALDLGRAAGDESAGIRLARKVAMMTYRSDIEFSSRFARERVHESTGPVDGTFDVEHYLERHGEKLAARFDADTYRTITRAMDLHDIGRGRGSVESVLASITQPALCIGISSDVLYPVREQSAMAALLPNATYAEIESDCGHDAFLVEWRQVGEALSTWIGWSAVRGPQSAGSTQLSQSSQDADVNATVRYLALPTTEEGHRLRGKDQLATKHHNQFTPTEIEA